MASFFAWIREPLYQQSPFWGEIGKWIINGADELDPEHDKDFKSNRYPRGRILQTPNH